VVELHNRVVGPELHLDFLTQNYSAGLLQQDDQNLDRPFRKRHLSSALAQFARPEIKLERSEVNRVRHLWFAAGC